MLFPRGLSLDNTSPTVQKRIQEAQVPSKQSNIDREFSWIVKTEKIPSGESLLKLFGKLLFEAAELTVISLFV